MDIALKALRQAQVDWRMLLMGGVLVAIALSLNIMTGGIFLSAENLYNIAQQTAVVGIVATVVVLIIVARHIDLSVGSMLAVVGMMSTPSRTAAATALRVGGTMEMAGTDESITQRRVRGITRAFPQYFPAFEEKDFAEVKPWSGLRPCSPDGMPYIGRTQRWKNLTLATGHAMMGLSLAPATGKIVADLLAGEKSTVALELMSPDRFA